MTNSVCLKPVPWKRDVCVHYHISLYQRIEPLHIVVQQWQTHIRYIPDSIPIQCVKITIVQMKKLLTCSKVRRLANQILYNFKPMDLSIIGKKKKKKNPLMQTRDIFDLRRGITGNSLCT